MLKVDAELVEDHRIEYRKLSKVRLRAPQLLNGLVSDFLLELTIHPLNYELSRWRPLQTLDNLGRKIFKLLHILKLKQ